MSFGTFNKIRGPVVAACLFSLAVFGACDNPRLAATVSDMDRPLAGSGARPAWYRGSAPMIRHQIDAARNRSWILAWDGIHAYDNGTRKEIGRVALPGWSWVGEPYGCAPALAIGPQGEAIISSDIAPVMWRVDSASLAVSRSELVLDADTSKDVGFSGLVYAPEQGVFIATSSFHGSVWRIDPLLRTAQKIALVGRLPRSCGWNVAPPEPRRGNDSALSLCLSRDRGRRQINLAADLRTAHIVEQACKSQG